MLRLFSSSCCAKPRVSLNFSWFTLRNEAPLNDFYIAWRRPRSTSSELSLSVWSAWSCVIVWKLFFSLSLSDRACDATLAATSCYCVVFLVFLIMFRFSWISNIQKYFESNDANREENSKFSRKLCSKNFTMKITKQSTQHTTQKIAS